MIDDRELRDDRGQLCTKCGTNFKYQYLYDDHYPCRGAQHENQVKVPRFWLQPTKSFSEGAPQRESYETEAAFDRACTAYADEWRKTYLCAGCSDVACPQCGAQGARP